MFKIFTSVKHIKILIYLLGIFPLSFIVFLLTFYFHAGIVLGHLPIPSLNDPKNFTFYDFYKNPVLYSFTGSFISFLVWVLISIYYSKLKIEKLDFKPIVITLLLYLFCILLIFSKISEWFSD